LPFHEASTLRPGQRIVTKLPLAKLWDESGTIFAGRIRYLDKNSIKQILRTGPAQFIVASCGKKLIWIPIEERFDFWKTVRPQIADPSKPIYLEQFANETAYVASEWCGDAGECLILLEMHH
jgi:hypothetical protein